MKDKFQFVLGSPYDITWRDDKVFDAELIDGRFIVTWEDDENPIEYRRTVYSVKMVEKAILEGYWRVLN